MNSVLLWQSCSRGFLILVCSSIKSSFIVCLKHQSLSGETILLWQLASWLDRVMTDRRRALIYLQRMQAVGWNVYIWVKGGNLIIWKWNQDLPFMWFWRCTLCRTVNYILEWTGLYYPDWICERWLVTFQWQWWIAFTGWIRSLLSWSGVEWDWISQVIKKYLCCVACV